MNINIIHHTASSGFSRPEATLHEGRKPTASDRLLLHWACASTWRQRQMTSFLLFCKKTLKDFKFPLRDCNENDNKTIGLISKTTTLSVHYTFCTFLCRFCTTTTRKCLFFVEDINKQRRNFLFLSEIGYGPSESNSSWVHLSLTKEVGRKNRDKDWKSAFSENARANAAFISVNQCASLDFF